MVGRIAWREGCSSSPASRCCPRFAGRRPSLGLGKSPLAPLFQRGEPESSLRIGRGFLPDRGPSRPVAACWRSTNDKPRSSLCRRSTRSSARKGRPSACAWLGPTRKSRSSSSRGISSSRSLSRSQARVLRRVGLAPPSSEAGRWPAWWGKPHPTPELLRALVPSPLWDRATLEQPPSGGSGTSMRTRLLGFPSLSRSTRRHAARAG